VKEIAWKAQYRLHKRYCHLFAGGKEKQKVRNRGGAKSCWALSGPSEFRSNETAKHWHN